MYTKKSRSKTSKQITEYTCIHILSLILFYLWCNKPWYWFFLVHISRVEQMLFKLWFFYHWSQQWQNKNNCTVSFLHKIQVLYKAFYYYCNNYFYMKILNYINTNSIPTCIIGTIQASQTPGKCGCTAMRHSNISSFQKYSVLARCQEGRCPVSRADNWDRLWVRSPLCSV